MADIGKTIRTRLLAVSAVTDIVSTRIYPIVLPQGCTLPAIRYRRISGGSDEHIRGTTGAANSWVQIDCYATSYAAVEALAEQVRLAIHTYRGTVGGVDIHSVELQNRMDMRENPAHGDDVGWYVHTLDFRIVHSETAI